MKSEIARSLVGTIINLFLLSSFAYAQGTIKFSPTKETVEGMTEIKEAIENGKILDKILGFSFGYLIVGSGVDPFKVYEISSTDWEEVGRIFISASSLDRIKCREICNRYIMIHEGIYRNSEGKKIKRNYPNIQYWKYLRKQFI